MLFNVPLHPLTVHFPIVLFLCVVLFITISLFNKREIWTEVSYYLSGLSFVAAGVTILTGRAQAAIIAHNEEIHQLMETHETLAYVLIGFFGAMFLWLYIRRKSMKSGERIGFVLVSLAVAGLLAYQAHLGGRMVYQKGAGVQPYVPYLEQGHEHHHHEH